jgi:hypothetical protein
MGLLHASCDSARHAVQSRLEHTIKKEAFSSRLEAVDCRQFFERDGKFYDGKRFQIALFSPRENLTVYACNLADGWVSLYGNLVKAGAFDAYFFRATLSDAAQYKVFEMMGWCRGVLERDVRVLQDDDGWTFLNKGDPMSFESPMQYRKRQISERLNQRLIQRYSEAAGYGLSSVPEFDGQCWRFWRDQ